MLGGIARVVARFGVLFKGCAEGGAKCVFIEESVVLASALTADVKPTAF